MNDRAGKTTYPFIGAAHRKRSYRFRRDRRAVVRSACSCQAGLLDIRGWRHRFLSRRWAKAAKLDRPAERRLVPGSLARRLPVERVEHFGGSAHRFVGARLTLMLRKGQAGGSILVGASAALSRTPVSLWRRACLIR